MATPTMPSGSSIRRFGEIEPGHGGGRRRSDNRAGHHQPLRPRACDHAGDGLGEKAAHLLVEADAQRRRKPSASLRQQHRELQQAGNADRRRQHPRPEHRIGVPGEQHRDHGDQRDIEQQRRERSQRKPPPGVQQSHQHRDRAGEGEIRQHQPRVLNREIERPAAEESRRDDRDDQRHHQRNDDRERDQRHAHRAEHAACEGGGGRLALAFTDAQPGRDQRRIQRTLTEQAPHHIDELEGGQERIRHRPGAEQRRDQGIAGKAQQPRGQCSRRDGQEGADHGPL
ncbi:hypothetical protein ACVWY3_006078 [Bradyrhizobium sp. USDA 4486]